MKYKVLLAQDVALSGKKLLEENDCEVVIAPDESDETLKKYISDCDAVFSKTCFLKEDVLKAGKKLKVVAKHGVGVDNVVNVDTATKLGLYVVRTPLANMGSVAEHTVTALLALSKNVCAMDKATRNDDFDAPLRIIAHDVAGKTVGIIGMGNIGKAVAKIVANGLQMEVLGYDPYISDMPDYITRVCNLEDIFKKSDYVTLHLGASDQTKGIIDKTMFSYMKPTAYFLNFARGSIVNEKDLIEALDNHIIAGAALDVYEKEPINNDNPLLRMNNVLLSPHSSALTEEAMNRMSYQGAQGIIEILEGKYPTWCVNYNEVKRI